MKPFTRQICQTRKTVFSAPNSLIDGMKMEIMKYSVFLFWIFLSVHAFAGQLPAIPMNQYLEALDYSKEGKQTGCVLRITGEAENDLWVNVLLSVFVREPGTLFGMFKIDVRKVVIRYGVPLIKNGKVIYSSIGKIHNGWLKTDAGVQLLAIKERELLHGDAYMVSMEFDNAIDLLSSIQQTNFRVGFSKEDGADEVFEFNKRIAHEEAGKLSSCMKNLRDAREEKTF